MLEGMSFSYRYFEPTDKLGADVPNPKSHIAYGYAACCAILDDEGKVTHIYSAYDAGKVVNPMLLKGQIEGLEFHVLNEHTPEAEVEALAALFDGGQDVGLITEAGLPAVADPGSALVALCHRRGIRVIPFVGPSSLMMALMASGLNGQSFAFLGYLPAKTDERRNAIRNIEKQSAARHQTQIFIETPYRNDAMLEDLLRICAPGTRLCIAADITLPEETIRTRTVAQWRKEPMTIGKRPCVFMILA